MTDYVIGFFFIAAGIAVLVRALSRPPEIIGRNAAMKRMLSRASHE